MIKQIINTFVVIAACLGVAAFVLVLVKKQNCQTKEPLTTTSCGNLDDDKSKNIEKFDWESNTIGVNQVSETECDGLQGATSNKCCKVYDSGNAKNYFVQRYNTCGEYFQDNKMYAWNSQLPSMPQGYVCPGHKLCD